MESRGSRTTGRVDSFFLESFKLRVSEFLRSIFSTTIYYLGFLALSEDFSMAFEDLRSFCES